MRMFIVMLGVCLVALSASAATIAPAGEDVTTNDAWRSTDIPKPLDADGDDIYGTDGWFIALEAGNGDMPPAYATVTLLTGNGPEYGSNVQAPIDDPALTGPSPVANVDCGDWWLEPPPQPEVDFFSIRLNADANFRLGVLADQTFLEGQPDHQVLYESPQAVRVRGAGADSGLVDTLGPGEAWRNHDVDYFMFDINGQQGDEFIVSGLDDARWAALAMSGVTFDTTPEPSSLLLVLTGMLGLAVAYLRK